MICLITIADSEATIDRLVNALATLSREHYRGATPPSPLRSSGLVVAASPQVMTPRDAFFSPARAVALDAAVGEVSAELIVPYPPGIPVLAPGEIITSAKVDYLRNGAAHGMYVSGPADPSLGTIRIVA